MSKPKGVAILIAIGIALIVALLVSFYLNYQRGVRLERVEAKATKFDDYCRFVRINLETTLRVLERGDKGLPADVLEFRQHLANDFYSEMPQLDREAVARCSSPQIQSTAMFAIRNRCKPEVLCAVARAGDKHCDVDPVCLASTVRELIALIPR